MRALGCTIGILFLFFMACNMEKDIDVALPLRESSIVVECYLEPGQPYRLTLLESEGFFDPPGLPVGVSGAQVYITHGNDTIFLKDTVTIDRSSGKLFNYLSKEIVLDDYYTVYNLFVKDKRGRIVTGATSLLPPVQIDSMRWIYNSEGDRGGPTIYFQEDRATDNYYRYLITADSLTGNVVRDFSISDATFQSSQGLLTARPLSERGVKLYLSFFNLTKDHYLFLESTEGAIRANSNPFGQASGIESNVTGGYGIFAGISVDRKVVIVP